MKAPTSDVPLDAVIDDDRIHDEDVLDDDVLGDDDLDDGVRPVAWRGPARLRWVLFAALAAGILLVDQLAKGWVTSTLVPGAAPVEVLGDWLRVVYWTNSGILFGMLPQSAPAFAIVSIAVIGLIVVYHAKVGRGLVTTVALGLLLGGALGNLVDRLNHGAVVDWVDMGVGAWRFYTYNVGDAAITTAIVLLLLSAVFPRLADWAAE